MNLACAIGALCVTVLVAAPVAACTTFSVKAGDRVLVAKNYDWGIGDAMVLANKRGMEKTAAIDPRNPARWTSKYGSFTFNQYGRDNPTGGVNEAGLVVELMWLDAAIYPPADSKPAIGVLEWIQFQLDNFATTAEVLQNAETVRISSSVLLHYLVCDRSGECASIEYLDGKLVATKGATALTNDTFASSANYLKQFAGFGGTRDTPASASSLDRFVRANKLNAEFKGAADDKLGAVSHAFETLQKVSQGDYTQWNIVYDLKANEVHFRSKSARGIKTVNLNDFNWACTQPVQMLEMHFPMSTESSGFVNRRFVDYTTAANLDLIQRSYKGTSFLARVPQAEIEADARYPEKSVCKDGPVLASTPAPPDTVRAVQNTTTVNSAAFIYTPAGVALVVLGALAVLAGGVWFLMRSVR